MECLVICDSGVPLCIGRITSPVNLLYCRYQCITPIRDKTDQLYFTLNSYKDFYLESGKIGMDPPCSCLKPLYSGRSSTPEDHGIDLDLVKRLVLADQVTSHNEEVYITEYKYLPNSPGWGLTSLRYILSVSFVVGGTPGTRTYFVKVPVTTAYHVKSETHHLMKQFLEKDLSVFFNRESIFYSEVVEKCFQRAQILKTKPYFPFPRFYYSRRGADCQANGVPGPISATSCDLLILEDLGQYREDRSEDKNLDHLRLLCSALGSLHAMGTAIVCLHPDLAQSLSENLSVLLGSLDDDFSKQVTELIRAHLFKTNRNKMALQLLRLCSDGRFRKEFLRSFSLDGNECLLHLDIWNGNFMFLYDVDDNTPLDVRLIDFQLTSLGSAGFELATVQLMWRNFIKHRTELLKIYRENFRNQLHNLGIVREPYGSKMIPFENTMCYPNSLKSIANPFDPAFKGLRSTRKFIYNYMHLPKEQQTPLFSQVKTEIKKFNKRERILKMDSIMILGERFTDYLIQRINRDYLCMLIFWLYKGSPLINLIYEEMKVQVEQTENIEDISESQVEVSRKEAQIDSSKASSEELSQFSKLFPELKPPKPHQHFIHQTYNHHDLKIQLGEAEEAMKNFEVPRSSLLRLVLWQGVGPKSCELIENVITDLYDRLI